MTAKRTTATAYLDTGVEVELPDLPVTDPMYAKLLRERAAAKLVQLFATDAFDVYYENDPTAPVEPDGDVEEFDPEAAEVCPKCASDLHGAGQWTTSGGRTLCYVCGRCADGLTPIPVNQENTMFVDYVRQESDPLTDVRALIEWIDALVAVRATWTDESSVSGAEVTFELTVPQAFRLALDRHWFDCDPHTGAPCPVPERLAGIMTLYDVDGVTYAAEDFTPEQRADAVRQLTALWDAFCVAPASAEFPIP